MTVSLDDMKMQMKDKQADMDLIKHENELLQEKFHVQEGIARLYSKKCRVYINLRTTSNQNYVA